MTSKYVTVLYKNPFTATGDKIDRLNENIENIVYWINPLNWFVEAHEFLSWAIHHPSTAETLMASTIVGAWLIMLGAQFPKKWIFWGWITYWVLRGLVYRV